MRRFFIEKSDLDKNILKDEEFIHAVSVLRMKEKDRFIAISNDEYDYICEIMNIGKNVLNYIIKDKTINVANPKIKISVFQALAKGDKMEFLTQKLTEIGVTELIPVYSKNCDVKANTHRIQRLEKIAQSACKQCGRSKILKIGDVLSLKDSMNLLKQYDVRLFANETEKNHLILDVLKKNKNPQSIALIIGPEGGWSLDEIELLSSMCESVTFGNRILRTETAGVYLGSIVSNYYGV